MGITQHQALDFILPVLTDCLASLMLGTSPRLLTRPISKTKQIGTLWGLSATFHLFIPRQETANSQKLVPGKRAYQHTSLGIWRLPSRLRWDSLRSESTVGSLFRVVLLSSVFLFWRLPLFYCNQKDISNVEIATPLPKEFSVGRSQTILMMNISG